MKTAEQIRVTAEDIRFALETAKDRPHLVLVYSRQNDWYERKAKFEVLESDQIIFDPGTIAIGKKDHDMNDHIETLVSIAFVKLLEDITEQTI
jgi:hypothetical protein